MSNAFLAEFDALAFPAFAGMGVADSATYTAPGGDPVACTVLVDLAVAANPRDFAGARRDRLTFMLADVSPVAGASVVVGSTTYILFEPDRADESASAWWVEIAAQSSGAFGLGTGADEYLGTGDPSEILATDEA